jgi:hypothetical protein
MCWYKFLILLVFNATLVAAEQDNDLFLLFWHKKDCVYKKDQQQRNYIGSLKVKRNFTMAGVYENLAKFLTKEFEDSALDSIKKFPSLNRSFAPLNSKDFVLLNNGVPVLDYIDVVVDDLKRKTDPYWGDIHISLNIELTESGKEKIGWLSPFAPNSSRCVLRK